MAKIKQFETFTKIVVACKNVSSVLWCPNVPRSLGPRSYFLYSVDTGKSAGPGPSLRGEGCGEGSGKSCREGCREMA